MKISGISPIKCCREVSANKKSMDMNNKELKEIIEKYIDEHEQEMIADVIKLCRINSVRTDAEDGMPYGSGPYRALMAAKEMCAGYGFRTKEYADRVISADMNRCEKGLDILAHTDVVAPGDGWSVTEPFEPKLIGDALYGRGTSDDKGPAIAALYAMRAVNELGLPVSKNCRLILGSDEECGSSDIPHYYAVEQPAPMTFSPDAEFPVINIEKGQFRGDLLTYLGSGDEDSKSGFAVCSNADRIPKELLELVSGDTVNIVPGKGYAVLRGFNEAELKKAVDAAEREINADYLVNIDCNRKISDVLGADDQDLTAHGQETCSVILITGKGAHASTPEGGVNAGIILINILSELCFDNAILNDRLQSVKKLFPYEDFYGRALGIELNDPESGSTTVTPDIFEADRTHISIKFDSRTSVLADEDNTILKVARLIEENGFSFKYSFKQPHVVSAESDFVQTLLSQYELVTGKKGCCMALGGGTYVHDIENGVAFGAVGETTDTHMHGADEFILVSELKQAAVIYAMCIAELCS